MEHSLSTGIQLSLSFIFILLGWAVGKKRESRHCRDINRREQAFRNLPVVTTKHLHDERPVERAHLVHGSVVIAVDAFKVFTSSLRKLVGGEMRGYAPLLDRARREAILRLIESAPDADLFLNLRIETSKISGSAQKMGSVEAIAYATAIRFSASPANDGISS